MRRQLEEDHQLLQEKERRLEHAWKEKELEMETQQKKLERMTHRQEVSKC